MAVTTASASARLVPDGSWQVDGSRSRVGFAVRKLGHGLVRGRLGEARGALVLDGGAARAHGAVRVAGLDTGNPPVQAGDRHRIEVHGEIDRRDFGLTWNRAIEASGVVATTVRLELDLELVRVSPAVHD